MAKVGNVRSKLEIPLERLDGGLNKKDGPSKIDLTESPDCLNVTFGDRGSVETRQGTSYYNSAPVASSIIDGLTTYNDEMVTWHSGNMYRMSGTTEVLVTPSAGQFTSGTFVAYEQFQDILFCSDGLLGPWRYEGGNSFYKMGITIPSAPVGASDTSGGGGVAADTYYYKVSFINSHAVEGEPGSSVAVTLAASASVDVSGVPVGAAIDGVAKRNIYRATSTSGPFRFVRELADNVTSSFSDNVAVGAEGAVAVVDGSSPTPFTTIKAHKERLWFDNALNRTLVSYTEFDNPFVSEALNLISLRKGDGSPITAIGVQNDLVTVFKEDSIWVIEATDPSDDTTFAVLKSPANNGIVGPRAFIENDNGIIFVAKRSDRIVGIQLLSGFNVVQTQDQFLLTSMLSRKIESEIFSYPSNLWNQISMASYDNRIYMGVPRNSASTRIDGVLWFDINRIVRDENSDPGSWAPWNGDVGARDFTIFDGRLYGGSSIADGYILRYNNGTYTDASGAAIDSYWWSKQIGGEVDMESWVKDFRHVLPWYERLGSYFMNMKIRLDGSTGVGDNYTIDLTPGGTIWGTGIWGTSTWGGGVRDFELEKPVGPKIGKRIQVGFDNQNTAGQGFKVHALKIRMNLRRQR